MRSQHFTLRHYTAFIMLTVIGFIIRYVWMMQVPNPPVSDFLGYYRIALNVYHNLGVTLNGVDPVGFQGAAYPVLLGWFFKLVGHTSVMTAKYFGLILSVLTMIILFDLFRLIFHKTSLIFAAYAIVVLLPNYFAYTSVLGTEILFMFFMSVTLWLQFANYDKRWRYPLLGVFIACTALTRPYYIVYPIVLAVAEWLRHKSFKQALIACVATGLVMCAVIAPWTYRNYQKFDTFVPIAYNSGYVLFVNNNDSNWYGGWMDPKDIQVSDSFVEQFKEKDIPYPQHPAKADALFSHEAKKWILSHPLEFIELGMLRLKNTFFNGAQDIEHWTTGGLKEKLIDNGYSPVDAARTLTWFAALCSVIVYVLSSLGFLYALVHGISLLGSLFRKNTVYPYVPAVVTLNIGFFSAVYFASEGQARYNNSVLIFFVIAAVSVCAVLFERLNHRSDL